MKTQSTSCVTSCSPPSAKFVSCRCVSRDVHGALASCATMMMIILHPNVGANTPALTRRGRKTSVPLQDPPLPPRTPTNRWPRAPTPTIQEWQHPWRGCRRRMTMDCASACAALHSVRVCAISRCVLQPPGDIRHIRRGDTRAQLQHRPAILSRNQLKIVPPLNLFPA